MDDGVGSLLVLLLFLLGFGYTITPWILCKEVLCHLFHMPCVCLLVPHTETSCHERYTFSTLTTPVERRISTAWLYDRNIPSRVTRNSGDLADTNPTMRIHVYCGTTQCVYKVAGLEKENVVVRFAVISDIVRGTPLEKWVANHPINKLLAGPKFETHFHEVTTLRILWQHGGFYVNPLVVIADESLPEYYNNASNEKVMISKGVLPSTFDVCYFSKSHPIIKKMIETYICKY